MVDLDQGPCAIKRLSGCGAGHEYLAVAPNGDIYPCHQFVGNKDFLMGNVNENKIDENIEKMFERSNVYTKENVRIVLRNSIAAVVAVQMRITLTVI